MGEDRLMLVYRIGMHDPSLNLQAAQKLELPAAGDEHIGIVEFSPCYGMRFGQPFPAYPYAHRLRPAGLLPDVAHRVEGSRWLEELCGLCLQYAATDLGKLARAQHFALCFHDEVLECVAHKYQLWHTCSNISAAAVWAVQWLEQLDED
jgi:hypothetical protein